MKITKLMRFDEAIALGYVPKVGDVWTFMNRKKCSVVEYMSPTKTCISGHVEYKYASGNGGSCCANLLVAVISYETSDVSLERK